MYDKPGMPLPYCVYVLFSDKDRQRYIGMTTDLAYSEFHSNEQDAVRREDYFKTTAGKRALSNMIRNSDTEPSST